MLRAVLLHGEVAQVRVVVDEQLGDRVDEMIGGRRAEAVEHRRLRAFAQRDERVRERGPAVALAPVQDQDRVLDDDAGGHVHERAAGEERVVQRRERVGRRARHAAEQLADQLVLARGDAARAHALGFERGIELVVHDAAVAHDDHPRVLARPPRPTGRRRARARRPARRARLRRTAGSARGRARRCASSARSPRTASATSGRRAARPRPVAAATSHSGPPSARAASAVNASGMSTNRPRLPC